MAAKKTQSECANCRRLEKRVAKLEADLAKVMDELAKAKKNSSNSSKPPSGDIVNPAPKSAPGDNKATKRKRGGQPGHQRHQRIPFQPNEIDNTWIYYYTGCPCCGGELIDTELPDKVCSRSRSKTFPSASKSIDAPLRNVPGAISCIVLSGQRT